MSPRCERKRLLPLSLKSFSNLWYSLWYILQWNSNQILFLPTVCHSRLTDGRIC